jgi:hypothetical protein
MVWISNRNYHTPGYAGMQAKNAATSKLLRSFFGVFAMQKLLLVIYTEDRLEIGKRG